MGKSWQQHVICSALSLYQILVKELAIADAMKQTTYESIGINLEDRCFSHGQFYVAASRISSPEGLFIYSPTEKVQNIVYEEVL